MTKRENDTVNIAKFDGEAFSVYQFFADESYECVRYIVDAEEATNAAKHYSNSVSAKMGLTHRILITDLLDRTVFEWEFGKGIVFPIEARERDASNLSREDRSLSGEDLSYGR